MKFPVKVITDNSDGFDEGFIVDEDGENFAYSGKNCEEFIKDLVDKANKYHEKETK